MDGQEVHGVLFKKHLQPRLVARPKLNVAQTARSTMVAVGRLASGREDLDEGCQAYEPPVDLRRKLGALN